MQQQNQGGKSRSVFSVLIYLALPAMAEQLMGTLFQYVDTAMVGHLGQEATAAVSVSTTITWLMGSLIASVGTAVLILLSRADGAGDEEEVREIASQALFLAVVVGLFIGALGMALSPMIPVWMGAEEAIRENASRYFFAICIPMVFRAMTGILGAALRAMHDTKTPMLISLFANILNVIFNYLCIYVLGMGVLGAAMGTVISSVAGGTLMLRAFRRQPKLSFPWRQCRPRAAVLRKVVHLGAPIMAGSATSCFGYVLFAGMVSGMGTTIFAAHSIAVSAEEIFYIPGYGLRTAASTLIGNARGEGDHKKARSVGKVSLIFTVIMMSVGGLILYAVAEPLMSIFTNDSDVVSLGAAMLRIVAFSEPFFGLMVIWEGVYYGLGRTRYVFWAELCSMYGIRILFTYLVVHVWGLGLQEVWYCMVADNITKAVLLSIPFIWKALGRRKGKLFP